MNIQIIRTAQGTESTLGVLIADGQRIGYVLEDEDRGLVSSMPLTDIKKQKVYGRTAIPTGRYRVAMTDSKRFGKEMPELLNVPGYGGIRLHSGNLVTETDGCPLPGTRPDQDKLGYWRVWESRKTYQTLLALILKAEARKEPVWCEITRLYK